MKKILQKAIPKLYGFYFNALHLFSNEKAAAVALEVFSTPRKGKVLEHQKDFLSTARTQQIAFEDGLFMLYHWKGTGPTVLLNHGWESNSFRWKYLVDPLRKLDYNIISIDAPAHGLTDGSLFTAVKYSKIIKTTIELYEPQIVIAHSVGAMATVFQESKSPHAFVKKLILLGSPNRLEVIMENYQALVSFNDAVYKSLNDLLKNNFGYFIKDFNTADFVQKISAPTLLIHNPNDLIVPFQAMKEIASAMPNATTYSSKTGGHSLYTQEVIDEIVKFLNKM
ncbi:alpha/beta hydrolase [Nonlabens sp.]|uniref:alpha/beta fold hydrolase n=1 Tax=Nonlabens sp. TaxID=1888209 RepID=UPI0025D8A5D9|nr:alpha/beta hydrolase [Nonlabens sp.]